MGRYPSLRGLQVRNEMRRKSASGGCQSPPAVPCPPPAHRPRRTSRRLAHVLLLIGRPSAGGSDAAQARQPRAPRALPTGLCLPPATQPAPWPRCTPRWNARVLLRIDRPSVAASAGPGARARRPHAPIASTQACTQACTSAKTHLKKVRTSTAAVGRPRAARSDAVRAQKPRAPTGPADRPVPAASNPACIRAEKQPQEGMHECYCARVLLRVGRARAAASAGPEAPSPEAPRTHRQHPILQPADTHLKRLVRVMLLIGRPRAARSDTVQARKPRTDVPGHPAARTQPEPMQNSTTRRTA